MPQFKNRQEYERWKAERQKETAERTEKIRQKDQEDRPPESLDEAPAKKMPDTTPPGLSPVNELFSASWETYQQRFGTLLPLYLISIVLFIIPLAVFLGGGFALSLLLPDFKYILIGIGGTLGFFISFVSAFWGMAGLTAAVSDRGLSIGGALGRGWAKVWSFIWLFSVFGFVITGGFLLFFFPGLFFLVWFSFAQFILAEEDERGMTAMLKSREYVKGFQGDVFLRMFLVWVGATVIGMVPFIGPVLSLVFFPFTLVYLHQIYAELRAARTAPAYHPSAGEKAKWLLISLLGYIVLPVMIIALLGAALLGQCLVLKALLQ